MAKKNTPSVPTIPLDLWRDLYQAAASFQLLAPWRWMDDTHVFGVNNEHGVRLVTVLGSMGEVFGLASYRGSAGANFLLRLRNGQFAPLLALPQPPESAWELTAFYSPTPVGEPPRPYYPKLALGVDAATGMILAFQLAAPDQTMAQAAARGLIQSIQASGHRPATIKMDSINLIRALQPLANALGAELSQAKSLPMANEARRALEAFGRRF